MENAGELPIAVPAVEDPVQPQHKITFFEHDGTVHGSWENENQRQANALWECLEKGTCRPNQGTVIIVVGWFFDNDPEGPGGENMWGRSAVLAIKKAGYTYLHANTVHRLLELYHVFHDRVKAVILDDNDHTRCLHASGLFHALFPDSENDIDLSSVDTRYNCFKIEDGGGGIPVWKVFYFHFWSGARHLLDRRWILSPENYYGFNKFWEDAMITRGPDPSSSNSTSTPFFSGSSSDNDNSNDPRRLSAWPHPPSPATRTNSNQYVGYSVEPSCLSVPYIPPEDRPRGQAYVFAKRFSYFTPGMPYVAWPLSFYDEAFAALRNDNGTSTGEGDGGRGGGEGGGVRFVAGAYDDSSEEGIINWLEKETREARSRLELELGHENENEERWYEENNKEFGKIPQALPGSIRNFGLLKPEEFIRKVGESRILVGVGSPTISPTPYEALCLGVPFINPILDWDKNYPNERSRWVTQHSGLRHLDPPYVYHVRKNDKAGFIAAIKEALERPIERFVLPDMTIQAVSERLEKLWAVDWRAEAEKLLEERRKSGQGNLFVL